MSARCRSRSVSAASPVVVAWAVLALAVALAACGVKSSPQHPEGSTYPRQYPASGDTKAAPENKAKQDAAPPPASQYDYPNRPPSR